MQAIPFGCITNLLTITPIRFLELWRPALPWYPAVHTKILPAQTPNRKRPPVTLNAVFEPQSKISPKTKLSIPNIIFNYSNENNSSALENKAESQVTLSKNTTLDFSEVIPEEI